MAAEVGPTERAFAGDVSGLAAVARYEAAIDRAFYRAMRDLERRQAARAPA